MVPSVGVLVAEGWAALRAGDAAGARRAFGSAAVDPASGDVIEGLARASYLELDFAPAIEGWERAYATYRASDDRIGAVRVARTLAYMYGSIVGDGAVMGGWLLAPSPCSTVTHRLLRWGGCHSTSACGKATGRGGDALRNACSRLLGGWVTAILEFVALAYLGATLVHDDRTDQGMVLLDEALAAVAGSEVDDFCVLQEIFCQLFAACEHAHDVSRADQWIRVGEAIAARRRAAGRFSVLPHPLRRPPHQRGPLARGRPGAHRGGAALGPRPPLACGAARWSAWPICAPGRAATRRRSSSSTGLEGDLDAARSPRCHAAGARRHVTGARHPRAGPGRTRPGWYGDGTSARRAGRCTPRCRPARPGRCDCLRAGGVCGRHVSPYLAGSAALARGRLCVATGNGDPQACFHEALVQFERAQMPIDVAHARLELANAVLGERPDVARAEAQLALAAFGAARCETSRRRRSCAASETGGSSTLGGKGAGPEQARGRGARAAQPRPIEQRDLGPALHQSQDGRAPRRPRPRQTRPAQPVRGRRVRRSGPNPPSNRGSSRCPETGRAQPVVTDDRRITTMAARLRRHHRGRPLRRRAHCRCCLPGRATESCRRSGVVPERHRFDAHDPRPGRRRAASGGACSTRSPPPAARPSRATRSTSDRSRSQAAHVPRRHRHRVLTAADSARQDPRRRRRSCWCRGARAVHRRGA